MQVDKTTCSALLLWSGSGGKSAVPDGQSPLSHFPLRAVLLPVHVACEGNLYWRLTGHVIPWDENGNLTEDLFAKSAKSLGRRLRASVTSSRSLASKGTNRKNAPSPWSYDPRSGFTRLLFYLLLLIGLHLQMAFSDNY